jgi:hypothetical protein
MQKHVEERGLLNARQFDFRARHSTTLQCMRLTDNVTLHFNNNISMAAPYGTLACCMNYQNWNFRPISSSLLVLFLHNANSVFWQKAKCLRQGKCQQGCHKVLSCPLHCTIYIYDAPQTSGVYLALFADDTCLFATNGKEGFVV